MKTIKTLGMPVIALSCLLALFLQAGCKSPSPFLFTPYTNVVSETVLPVRTNFIPVYVTNPATQVVITSVVERVVYQTNTILEVGHRPNTNAGSIAETSGAISNVIVPGTGGLVNAAIGGLLALAAGFWRHRIIIKRLSDESDAAVSEQKLTAENVAKALTYTIENYRDVLLKAPNGEAIDSRLLNEAQKQQTALKVGELVASTVATYVRNPDIQEASNKIAEEARRLAGTP